MEMALHFIVSEIVTYLEQEINNKMCYFGQTLLACHNPSFLN